MLPRTQVDSVPIPGMASCALAASATCADGARAVDMVFNLMWLSLGACPGVLVMALMQIAKESDDDTR